MKKKLLIQRLISLGVGLVGAVFILVGFLVINNAGEATTLSLVFLIAGLIVIIAVVIWNKIITDTKRSYCMHCDASMAGCEYYYEEVKRYYDKNSNDDTLHVQVHIEAVCPECGEVKSFIKTFNVRPGSNNLQYQVDNYCRSIFKH